jgi:hypothetical protein
MPDKHPNSREWGGPGSSHQNADQEPPAEHDPRLPGTPTNDAKSHVSKGGGERDIHHGHSPEAKSTSHKH